MRETELTAAIMELAEELGVLAHHCQDSRHCTGPKGFVDVPLVGSKGVVWVEAKNDYSDTSAEQDLWRWNLHKAGQHWMLLRPRHLADGTVRSVLERIA